MDEDLKRAVTLFSHHTCVADAPSDSLHIHTSVLFATRQAPGLPKTRSGKIMRRVLRKIAANEEDQLGDTSTLADPTVVKTLVENRGR